MSLCRHIHIKPKQIVKNYLWIDNFSKGSLIEQLGVRNRVETNAIIEAGRIFNIGVLHAQIISFEINLNSMLQNKLVRQNMNL